ALPVGGQRREGDPEGAVDVETQSSGSSPQVEHLAPHPASFTEVVQGRFSLDGSATGARRAHAIEGHLGAGEQRRRGAGAARGAGDRDEQRRAPQAPQPAPQPATGSTGSQSSRSGGRREPFGGRREPFGGRRGARQGTGQAPRGARPLDARRVHQPCSVSNRETSTTGTSIRVVITPTPNCSHRRASSSPSVRVTGAAPGTAASSRAPLRTCPVVMSQPWVAGP